MRNSFARSLRVISLLTSCSFRLASSIFFVSSSSAAFLATNKLNDLKKTAAIAQTAVDTAKQKVADATKVQSDAQEALAQAQNELAALQQKEALAKQVAEQQAKLAAEKEAKDNGYHVENNNVVDSKGNNVQGWTVKNGQMVDPNNAVIEQSKLMLL